MGSREKRGEKEGEEGVGKSLVKKEKRMEMGSTEKGEEDEERERRGKRRPRR